MKQFRIYYESLEQGANFIKPIIQSVVGDAAEIVLVRRPKNASELNEGSVAALLTMTTPDALITGIYNNREYPLVLIEFTEAVTTEDHELQRTYGAIAAYLAGAYYLKDMRGILSQNGRLKKITRILYSVVKSFHRALQILTCS